MKISKTIIISSVIMNIVMVTALAYLTHMNNSTASLHTGPLLIYVFKSDAIAQLSTDMSAASTAAKQ